VDAISVEWKQQEGDQPCSNHPDAIDAKVFDKFASPILSGVDDALLFSLKKGCPALAKLTSLLAFSPR